jgi:hypothetical protein
MCSWFIVPIRHDCSGRCSWVMAPHVKSKRCCCCQRVIIGWRCVNVRLGKQNRLASCLTRLLYARGTNWSKKLEWTFCFPFSSTCGFNGSVTQYRIKKKESTRSGERKLLSPTPHHFPPFEMFFFLSIWTVFVGSDTSRSSSRSVLLDGKWPKTPLKSKWEKVFSFDAVRDWNSSTPKRTQKQNETKKKRLKWKAT